MRTIKVKFFFIFIILLVVSSVFAKITRYESEHLPANPQCDKIIEDTTAGNNTI